MPKPAKHCSFVHSNGSPCRRWATPGAGFCYHHRPAPPPNRRRLAPELHPLLRLTRAEDLFDVIRETINAVRLGRIPIGQAYAIGYLADAWLRVRRVLNGDQREELLRRQMLPETLAHEDIADEALADGSPILPSAEPATEAGETEPGASDPAEAGHTESPSDDEGDAILAAALESLQREPQTSARKSAVSSIKRGARAASRSAAKQQETP